nr:hypothetical protein [Tanacetum cinerariifolium]
MRTRNFFQKTCRKITIDVSDTAGYDKSKVKCFNYHKLGHFARECKQLMNQVRRNRNQDSSRRTVNVEETSSKAMVAIDGAGFDWSYKEFQQPEFEGYGPKNSNSVSKNISNKVKESPDALLVKELGSDKLEKKTVFPTVAKIEFGHPQKEDQGYVDSKCSRHMTGNMSHISYFKEFDEGYVTFRGGAKGGKITGKGTFKTAKTINGEAQSHARVEGKKIITSEASIRRDLQLADKEGVDCLPNSTIIEQLALIGPKTTAWNEFSSTVASAIICLSTN